MSAIVWLPQRESCHLLVDASSYFKTGVVERFLDKCRVIPELHCAVTTLGPSLWQEIIFAAIRENFASFDEVKAGIEPLMSEVFEAHKGTIEWVHIATEVWVIGWSTRHDRPEGFTIFLEDFDEYEKRRLVENLGDRRPFEARPISSVAVHVNPTPTAEKLFEAGWHTGVPATDDLIPEIDLLHLMEIQRRIPFESVGHSIYVGGYALLTSVDRNGVTQRRVHEWPEDKVGELIKPPPMDWLKWRAEREGAQAKEPISLQSLRKLNRHDRRKLEAAQR
jgi:hypothetical protein